MSQVFYTGIIFQVAGIALEQFALYRKTISRFQRNCNDSKATLLLYFSTGICCELTAFYLLPFASYLISLNLHLVFYAYFAFKYPPTLHFKAASVLFLLSFCLLLFQGETQPKTANTIGLLPLFFIFFIVTLVSGLSKYAQHKLAKIALCSGFGTCISICLKELDGTIWGILDGEFPSLFKIFCIFLLIGAASLVQSALSELLMKKCEIYQIYSGYFLVNLLSSIIIAQIYFEEPLSLLGYTSLVLSVVGALLLCSENYSDKNLVFQDSRSLGHV